MSNICGLLFKMERLFIVGIARTNSVKNRQNKHSNLCENMAKYEYIFLKFCRGEIRDESDETD